MNCNKQFFKNQYDQLNRIKRANVFMADAGVVSSNTWTSAGLDATKYAESYTYDRNGNIETLKRQSHQGAMDDLGYVYDTVDGHKVNNRLLQVTDANGDQGMGDIDTQAPNNYSYDALGNLVRNEQENIESIEWTISGKVHKIIRNSSEQTLPDMEFEYDPSGNRIVKLVKPRSGGTLADQAAWDYTYYVRDAQGNIMATYKQTGTGTPLSLSDLNLYGSDRLGTLDVDKPLADISFTGSYAHYMGKKQYELKNHLGNVLATVSDYAQPQYTGATLTGFTAQLLTAQDYYPFGMIMPGRSFSSNGYRFGFNGKETDSEWSGQHGATYDYGFRIYDSRIAKFLSVDPLTKKYPELTPFQFASNRPIDGLDLDGLEYAHYYVYLDKGGKSLIINIKVADFTNMTAQQIYDIHGITTKEFYQKYSKSFGKEGRGTRYTYFLKNDNCEFDQTYSIFETSGTFTSHGFYYGAGGTSEQGNRSILPASPFYKETENSFIYKETPIDRVDELAMHHDMNYEKSGVEDWENDPNGIEADREFVNGLKKYINDATSFEFVDPITKRKPSEESIDKAMEAIGLFTITIARKEILLMRQKKE